MRTLVSSVVAVCLIAILSGCGTAAFNVEALSGIKRVAVVGVTMEHLPVKEATESNNKVLKEVMAESADVLAEELESACGWKVLRVSELRKSEPFKKIMSKLDENSAYSFYEGYRNKNWLFPDGLSDIPRSYIYSEGTHPAILAGKGALKQMCADLDVDGVIIMHIAMFAGNATGFRFSGGAKRTYGYIKFNPLMTMMDKNGTPVFSVGSTNLDDLAPSKHRVPIYKGASTSSYALDLDHDHVRKAYVALEKKTFRKLAGKVKKNLPQ